MFECIYLLFLDASYNTHNDHSTSMTRQQEDDEGGGDAASAQPLLLDVRELARVTKPPASADTDASDQAFVVAAFGTERVAVLEVTRRRGLRGTASVRIGVFYASDDVSAPQSTTTTHPSPWAALWTREEAEAASSDDAASDFTWTLAWSSDGSYLIVSGGVVSRDGASQVRLWIYTTSAWLAVADAASAPSARPHAPLLIQVDPATYLSLKDARGAIVAVFCDTSKRHRVFYVTSDSQIVKVDIQLPKLALLTLEDNDGASASTKALFAMAVVQRMRNWHASVDTAAFDPASATLVVTGGIADPSDELVARRASSLSVWKVRDAEPFCELLDSTVVLRDAVPLDGDQDNEAATESDGLETLSAPSTGLLASLARPLAFITGRGSAPAPARVLAGSIRQLAVSPRGEYVAMLDDAGRFAVREIATCSDVLTWQSVASSSTLTYERLRNEATATTSVLWASSDVLSCVLATGGAVFGSLVTTESLEGEPSDARAIAWRPVETHYRSFSSRHRTDVRVHALAAVASSTDAIAGFELATVDGAFAVSAFAAVDVAAFVDALVASQAFDRALVVAEALEATESVDLDRIHRHVWTQFKAVATINSTTQDNSNCDDAVLLATDVGDASPNFATALHHLRSLQDAQWVTHECATVVAVDSPEHMLAILETGLRVSAAQDAATEQQQRLQSFRYRLETLNAMLAAEAQERTGDVDSDATADEQLYDGAVFRQFRRASIVDVAQELASGARVTALSVLFDRHAPLLAPRRLALLSRLPATLSPRAYAHLLPAAGPDATQLYTLVPRADAVETGDDLDDLDDGTHGRVRAVNVSGATAPDALDAADAALLDQYMNESVDVRYEAYARWFHDRVVEIDRVFGQLAVAHELSALATECLAAWDDATSDAKRAFEAFTQHVERLHTASYVLALPSCAFLTLDAWTALSIHDQMLLVVGDISDWSIGDSGDLSAVTDAIDRLHAVFVAQRCDALYTLDDALAALCQTLSAMSPASPAPAVALSALAISAHVLHHSNPSMPMAERWIQRDALLLRTAIDVVYAATTEALDRAPETHAMQHRAMVEHLWRVFQSLPVRKDDDGPEIAALQVQVDAMEDLLVTMDVLSKYGVLRSPKELQLELHDVSSATADDLLARMCRFALPGNDDGENGGLEREDDDDDSAERDAQQWMDVWRDATKLKTHVFGERISHDTLLDAILRHLLVHDRYMRAAEHLVTNWISSNADAVPHVLTLLLQSIQAKSDALCGHFAGSTDRATYAAVRQCTAIAEHVLSVALAAPNALDEAFTAAYTQQLSDEHDLVLACQLLDVLTYGAVKRAPSVLRPLTDARDRVNVVLEVLTTNPSHYKVSQRARDWFATHDLAHVLAPAPASSAASSELAAVLYLATLLRISDAETPQIVLKGAYAALYCGDYDVAYRLTTDVLATMDATSPDASDDRLSDDTDLQHLLSLVLDLVSASSFASWSKKLALCRRVFSAASIDSARLIGHQVTHLVLAAMHKLEAIEALATELGLSEADVEARRQQESSSNASTTAKTSAMKQRISAEELLLNELTLVVELLQEEEAKSDRAFVLRLLQKGFQVVNVSLTSRLAQPADESGDATAEIVASGDVDRAVRLVQHMSRLCFVEAIASAKAADAGHQEAVATDWREYLDLGCRYLVEWTEWQQDDDGRALETFWRDDIAPLLTAASPVSTGATTHARDLVVRHLHHFFTLQVASPLLLDMTEENGDAASHTHMLQERRARIEQFTSSYDAAKQFVASMDLEPEAAPEEGDNDDACAATASDDTSETLRARRSPLSRQTQALVRIAAHCQDLVRSHKKTQELEAMSSFFNETLDLERFADDATYRERSILTLATTRAHLRSAQQFAAKYGVDPFACVLAYVRAAFVPSNGSALLSPLERHEQLELAFERRSGADSDGDVLEQALARPLAFANCLLNASGDSVYDALDGTDHVGILLLLRMVLECSKRLQSQDGDATTNGDAHDALFPLSKAASDRVTLLFVCLKRLKELAPHHHVDDTVDFKRVCAAERCVDVVAPPASPVDARARAVAAVVPALNAKTIKVVSKILQKLHHVAPSAVVLIYLSHLLATIAREQQHTRAASRDLGADLAAYAYEACTPFLSVLSTEHVLLFHHAFLYGALPTTTDVGDAFYGQALTGLTHFHALVSPAKRVAIVSDTLRLVQTRFDAWHAAANGTDNGDALAAKTRELQALERELVEAAVWFVVDCAKQHAQSLPAPPSTLSSAHWDACARRLERWFTAASTDGAIAPRDELIELIVPLSQLIASVELTALLLEFVVLAAPPHSDAEDSSVAAMLDAVCRRVFAATVATHLSGGDAQSAVHRLASDWTTALRLDANGTWSSSASFAHFAAAIDALCGASPVAHKQSERAALNAIVMELESVASSAVQAVVAARKPLLVSRAEASGAADVAAAAVVAEWRVVLVTNEQQQQFERSAVLARLVLDSAAARAIAATERPLYEREAFGLQAKAAFSALQWQSSGDASSGVLSESLAFVLDIPTAAVLASFDAIVASALALVRSSSPALASRLTLTLANLLTLYDASAAEATDSGAITWPSEQQRALATRLQSQFAVGDAHELLAPAEATDDSARSSWWASLLLDGHWPHDRVRLQWYIETAAYRRITSPRTLEAFAMAHWDTARLASVELLLVSPFPALHAHHCERLVAFAAGTGHGDSDDHARLVELLLLRYDLALLLRAGLYPALVALVTAPRSSGDSNARRWTSSGEYLVCALVAAHEVAMASRLASALWHAHPLLWDFESARWTLVNFLKTLTATSARRIAMSSSSQDTVAVLQADAVRSALDAVQATLRQ